jgi:hypothetical protein
MATPATVEIDELVAMGMAESKAKQSVKNKDLAAALRFFIDEVTCSLQAVCMTTTHCLVRPSRMEQSSRLNKASSSSILPPSSR